MYIFNAQMINEKEKKVMEIQICIFKGMEANKGILSTKVNYAE